MNPAELVGLLAEPDRLRVVAALALGARTAGEIGDAAGLGTRDCLAALGRLQTAGLVESEKDGFVLRAELFKAAARDAAPEPEPTEPLGYADPRAERVVRNALRAGHLVRLPAHRGQRRLVLEHVATSFEPGVRYPEREVDVMLRAWSPDGSVDHVTLRRHLVDEGLLARERGEYWRSGGWADFPQG